MNLGLTVNVNAAAGEVVAGSMSLLSVNVATGNLLSPIASTLPTGVAVNGNFSFVLNCLHNASLVLCYELQEGNLPIERFCVVLGGVGLWDPSGRIYDATEYGGLVAAGCTPTEARAKSALTGAEVVLHRKHDGAFRRVLSGDPFVTPNVNPFVTEADGRYGWNVSAGTYRVVVSRSGYQTATSREAVVPPPDLELNVGLQPIDAPAAPSAEELAEREAFCDTPDPSPPPPPPPAEDPPSTVIPPPPPAASNPPSLSLAQILALLSQQSKASTPPNPADVRAGKIKVDRKGRLRVRLSCPAGSTTCAGQVMVVATKPTQLVAKKSYAIKGGRAKTVTLRISSKVRRQARAKPKRQLLVVAEQQNRVFTLGKPRFSG